MKNHSPAFTVIEIMVVIVLVAATGFLLFTQKQSLDAAGRDNRLKTSVNAIHYNLEEVYYQKNKYYPEIVKAETVKGIDSELLKDPFGKALGEQDSKLRYEAFRCDQGKCRGYTVRADLEKEADFIRESRNK